MHEQAMGFVSNVQSSFPEHFGPGARVLEYGSRDMNGSVRGFFKSPAEYVGVDAEQADGVDVVSLFHDYAHDHQDFDVVISTEAMEHDPWWDKSIENVVKHLRHGGLFVMTCAGPARDPHHVGQLGEVFGEYYENRTPAEIRSKLEEFCELEVFHGTTVRQNMDTVVYAVKA
jgi:SAM-dependent methyltransferase